MTLAQRLRNESWERVRDTLGPRYRQIVTLIERLGPLTPWEVSKHLGEQVYMIRPRLTELASDTCQILRVVSRKYYPPTDRDESVYDLVPEVRQRDRDMQLRLDLAVNQ